MVTGASSGIGQATALHLDRLGFHVFAGVRNPADADSLRQRASERLVPVLMDVTDPSSISAAAATVEDNLDGDGLAGLVNNAGIVCNGPLEFIPIEEFRRQFEVNVVGVVAVTQSFLPLIRLAKGRIIIVGSIGGRSAGPIVGPYTASKFAVEGLADSLRVELLPWNIHVSLIEPGVVATPMFDKSASYAREAMAALPEKGRQFYLRTFQAVMDGFEKMGKTAIPPEKVAQAIGRAMVSQRPKTRYLVGPDAYIQALMAWLLPDRARDAMAVKMFGLPTQAPEIPAEAMDRVSVN
jgi:NAD(P)-dependent dehydrogenase (short-subunit alcohol dehydrogenase family)